MKSIIKNKKRLLSVTMFLAVCLLFVFYANIKGDKYYFYYTEDTEEIIKETGINEGFGEPLNLNINYL